MKSFNTNQYKSPCYQCEERSAGCHSKCLKYIDYSQKMEVVRQARKEHSDRMARIGTWRK